MLIEATGDRMATTLKEAVAAAAASLVQERVTSTTERFLMGMAQSAATATGVSAQEFLRPDTQSAFVRLDQRRSSLNHQHFKVLAPYCSL